MPAIDQALVQRLRDHRSKRVVFLSHCILNENTRYLGGACRGGCIREIVQPCLDAEIGIVQTPCPEQQAWGGVLKRLLLPFYGAEGTLRFRLRRILLPLMLLYTRRIYRKLARETADQMEDYLVSGFSILGIVGVDGSPSCGVKVTLDLKQSLELIGALDVQTVTGEEVNAIIRGCLAAGRGLFIALLQEELERRQLTIPFLAHDLLAEIAGKQSNVSLFPS